MKNITTVGAMKIFALAGSVILVSACSGGGKTAWGEKSASPWASGGSIKSGRDAYEETIMETDQGSVADQLVYDPYASTPDVTVAEPEPAEVIIAEPEPVVAVSSGSGQDIMSLPANYYTVQLMASVDLDRVYKFAEKNQLSTRYVAPTVRDGVTWHVLLLDVYPDAASAKKARSEIAARLNTQPWVRSIGSVQKLIK
ncbi:MAG: SPOR domain-containing protein [Gammaproteobacteria bacterium]|nr:SPOR domain-containing protein [Gammaproteobacteria bacterium]